MISAKTEWLMGYGVQHSSLFFFSFSFLLPGQTTLYVLVYEDRWKGSVTFHHYKTNEIQFRTKNYM